MKHCIKSLLFLFTLLIFTSCGTQNNILYFIDEYEIWNIDTSVRTDKIFEFGFVEEILSDLENEIHNKINAITDDIFGHLNETDSEIEGDTHSGEETPKITNIYIFDPIQCSSIQSIKVSNEFGGYRVYRDSSDTFQMEGYGGVTFDVELFSSLVVSAGSPLAMEQVAQDMTFAQLTEYGLEEPQASWTVTTIYGEQFTVYVGDALTNNNGYYVKYADRDAVYIVGNRIADTILQPATILIQSQEIPVNSVVSVLNPNNSHGYAVCDYPMTWGEAKQYCESLGGHLATITSYSEQSFIEELLAISEQTHYWLGASDSDSEGIWKWITGESWSYTNWDKKQPDNYNADEDYLHILNKANPKAYNSERFKWNDTNNTVTLSGEESFFSTQYAGFICEWDYDDENEHQAETDVPQGNVSVSLSTLNPVSGGFTWNEGTPADPFGNSYTDAVNYTILHGDGDRHYHYYELYSEYKIDRKYTNLSFTISPYFDFGEDAYSYLQIYVNNILRYTSDIITRKSGKTNVMLDISDANTLKIVVRKGEYGCLMLSDVKLINDSDFISSHDNDYVSLSTLSPINGGFSWNNDYPQDPFSNTYTDSINYTILHGNGDRHYEHCELYSEYKVDKKHTNLSFTISPYSDFGEDASSYLQIYVNDVLRYTSDIITRKTGKKNVLLDISDANTLKIVVRKGDYGCLMLSDVKLINDLDFTSSLDDDYVSLSTLSPLNGGFEWNNDYPSDPLKNSYTDSINYTILHGNSHHYHYELSVEYYIDKKYKSLSINISPYADYGNEASTTLKIFVDDKLVYTSPAIMRKTNIISVPDISLVGATYLKLVVDKGDYGCLMLSDAKLVPIS